MSLAVCFELVLIYVSYYCFIDKKVGYGVVDLSKVGILIYANIV
ncbi:hypothetical protein GCM10011339_30350 [Echinicola rosea]|uniref:Uncharacterized protein n=1 Tax=Echinicola rosea TaxID=1807691 RepID=A0ABQ1V5D2_9BACT|nr:hypothetical protein GCM10011339_30350 [Echinicola rosea]